MNEHLQEINEILDFKENADYKKLSVDEIVILKKCITNLLDENKSFKDYAKTYLKSQIDRKNDEIELVKSKFIEEHNKFYDYKLRNEKAIEYIRKNFDFYYGDEFYDGYQEIINILKGDKNE